MLKRAGPLFRRNRFQGSGRFEIPVIPKAVFSDDEFLRGTADDISGVQCGRRYTVGYCRLDKSMVTADLRPIYCPVCQKFCFDSTGKYGQSENPTCSL